MLTIKDDETLGAKILVAGIGGCGCNAVDRMLEEGAKGVDFVCMNTDSQQLKSTKCPNVLQLGERVTRGLGAGGKPEVGESAAEESQDEISAIIEPYDMVFVTCGMGGGTGTGAAPVVARIAKDMRKLTVGVVTKPFFYEGNKRIQYAISGIERIRECVDTLIVIPNDKIYDILDARTKFVDGFRKADEVLLQSVQGITDLINIPGLINLDFADVQTAMRDKGIAHIGIGYGKGEDRATEAVKMAVESPLLETKLDGATDIIVNVCGDIDIMIPRIAMEYILGIVGPDVNVILGAMEGSADSEAGECKITVIATGIDMSRKQTGMAGMGRAGFAGGYINNNRQNMNAQRGMNQGVRYSPQGDRPVVPQNPSAMGHRPMQPIQGQQTAAHPQQNVARTQSTGAINLQSAGGNGMRNAGNDALKQGFGEVNKDIQSKINSNTLNIPSFLRNKN